MNYESITTCDVANGEDIGVVLWVSGCDVQCSGCHNKGTWNPESGKHFGKEDLDILLNELNKEHIKRFTLSGGHPLMPCNREIVSLLLQRIRRDFGDSIQIWLYTGYKYEDMDSECKSICNKHCDVVVDGPYIEELKDLSLPFRGSKNQRIIRIKDEIS